MSASPPGHLDGPLDAHLDLDALADVLAGEPAPAHLAGCAGCAATLAELRVASDAVTRALSALPAVSVPTDVASRLSSALVSAEPADAADTSRATEPGRAPASGHAPETTGGTVTTLPPPSARGARWDARRWLPAAAAVVLLLTGAGYGLSRLGGGGEADSTSTASGAKAAAAPLDVVRNSTGTDYTDRATLALAVPRLLTGTSQDTTAQAPAPALGAPTRPGSGGTARTSAAPEIQSQVVADPLARLRDNAGLADCLLALLPADDPSARPLALDYAAFRGAPALVVVLPSSLPRKLDVFVVGPGCSRANDSTLFYTSVDKP